VKEGIQTFFGESYEAACNALSIIKIAEEVNRTNYTWGQATDMLIAAIQAGYVYYNWKDTLDKENYTVLNGEKMLAMFTKRKAAARFVNGASYKAREDEYTIQRWKWGNKTHFRRPKWDPIINSQTVRNGVIDRITVYTVIQEEKIG
jgi:hypothetical protein